MSFILQCQRRAIEGLFSPEVEIEFNVKKGQRYCLDGKEIFLLGVSRGIGTCSDYHGINFAVFAYKGDPSKISSTVTVPIECAGGVLFRKPHNKEPRKWGDATRVVEKLRILHKEGASIHFTVVGISKSYTSI